MNIEVLLTEAEIAQEFTESMEARDLPEKFFYWFPLSVRAWRELSADGDFADLARTWETLGGKVAEITKHFPGSVPVVSYGAGDGVKDRLLIQALVKSGREVRYFPVDASQTLLETACAGAEDDDVEVIGIKADISSPMHLVLASDAAESPKLFLMSGNTIGGFDPIEQIKHIAQRLHETDRLILDAELYRDDNRAPPVHPRYVEFTYAPLLSIGVTEEDGEIKFEKKIDERHAGLHMLTKRFHARRDLRITVSGREIQVARGERIFMNFRYQFTEAAFRWLLEKQGGLKILDQVVSGDGAFISAVCSL
jgi:Histidine-specific methyltransferase, SAM-dependent